MARRSDGTWSTPSAILLHTGALDFLVGVDVYDALVVINSQTALAALRSGRCTLGSDVPTKTGPLVDDGEARQQPVAPPVNSPLWTYLKSRRYHVNLPIDGALVTERTEENERFYAADVGVADLLDRKARSTPREIKVLVQTIKAAQGDADVDRTLLPTDPAPGDVEHARPDHIFGIPDGDDPDPYGVHALEMSGLEIREAGSKSRPTSEQFEYRPSPTSPVYQTFHHRRSISSLSARARERDSYARRSVDRCTQTVNMSTQTPDELMHDLAEVVEDEPIVEEDEDEDNIHHLSTKDDDFNRFHHPTPDHERDVDQDVNAAEAVTDHGSHPHPEQDIDQEPEVVEAVVQIQAHAAPQLLSKARLVTIGKRPSPALPIRSPARPKMVTLGSETSSNIDSEHRGSDASVQSLSWTTTSTTSDAKVGAGSDAGRPSSDSPPVSSDRSSQSTKTVSTPTSLGHQMESQLRPDVRIEPDDGAEIHLHQDVRLRSEDQVVDDLLHEPVKMMIREPPTWIVDDHVIKTTTITPTANGTDLPIILPSLLPPPPTTMTRTLPPLSIGNRRGGSTTVVEDGILV